jgi:hypothetical protein
MEENCRFGPHDRSRCKILGRVKTGKKIAKWSNMDENLLNGVISAINIKLGGKNLGFTLSIYPIKAPVGEALAQHVDQSNFSFRREQMSSGLTEYFP